MIQIFFCPQTYLAIYTSDKKSLLEMKNKDLGLLKKVWKQERLSLETRHEHLISVPNSTSLKSNIHALFQDLNFLVSVLFEQP